MEKLDFETILIQASKAPMVKIDRELFLRKELKNLYDEDTVNLAINYNPAFAGIKTTAIEKIAKSCIVAETAKVTALSAVAGIPGGWAMAGTIPADLTQYFAHILRILQELIYLYGWKELNFDSNDLTEETKNLLTLFVGIMFGVDGAINAINKLAGQVAKQIAKKLPQKALTKGVVYPIVKKVATLIGVKMTKDVFAKGVSKTVPVVGAVVSGGLTFFSFKPMANKLKKYLSSCETSNPEFYKKMREEEIIDVNVQESSDSDDSAKGAE